MYVEDMRQAIGVLYSHIFHFFKSAMEWYQSRSMKKVLNSFNENFYDKFEEQITKIKSLSDWIQKKGNLKSRAELRDLRLVVDQMAEHNAKAWASYQEEKQKNEDWQKIGQTMLQMLRSSTQAWQYNPDLRLPDIHPRGNFSHILLGTLTNIHIDKAVSTECLVIDDKGGSRNRERTRSPSRSSTSLLYNWILTTSS